MLTAKRLRVALRGHCRMKVVNATPACLQRVRGRKMSWGKPGEGGGSLCSIPNWCVDECLVGQIRHGTRSQRCTSSAGLTRHWDAQSAAVLLRDAGRRWDELPSLAGDTRNLAWDQSPLIPPTSLFFLKLLVLD
jgi:hypothetical protein